VERRPFGQPGLRVPVTIHSFVDGKMLTVTLPGM